MAGAMKERNRGQGKRTVRALVYIEFVDKVTFKLKSKEGRETHRALVYERLLCVCVQRP